MWKLEVAEIHVNREAPPRAPPQKDLNKIDGARGEP
jgi:hypothetical protein